MALMRDETGKQGYISQERHTNSGKGGESEAVQKDETQDGALLTVGLRSGTGNNDAGRGDHLAHHAASAVSGGHEDRGDADLGGGLLLQAPKKKVGRGQGA